MYLSEFATSYAQTRTLSADYAKRLEKYALALETHARVCDLRQVLVEPVVNAFLKALARSPYTVKSYRGDLLTLWRAAADADLVPYPAVRKIYKPTTPQLLIECFAVEEARELLAHAATLNGCYPNGVARKLYWQAAIALAWDSGLRRGDVWKFRREFIRHDGSFRVVQSKTGQLVSGKLHKSTIARISKIKIKQPLEWTLDPSFFGRHFQRIVNGSGVGRGSFKFLRRSSGSYVEAEQPGAGRKHLGHACERVFSRHYDAKLGEHALPLPPEL